MSSQNLLFLLPTEKLITYPQAKLLDIWESILREYEELTGSFDYTQALRKVSSDTSKVNRLNGLMACYYLLETRPEIALEDLRYWKINLPDNSPASLNRLLTIINQERTRLNIEAIRKNVSIQDKVEFEDLVMYVENNIGANYVQLDIDKITVVKWVKMLKSIERKSDAIKKQMNGREYSTSK
jgi:hypothetical protein